jgi:diguanylate cyclase (GGDEF)-like protein
MNHAERDATGRSPMRLLMVLLISVFALEFGIMALFVVLANHALNSWMEAAIDAGLLSALLFPVLFFLVFRPLVRQIKDFEQAEMALRTMRDGLELRVQERTVDLEQRNREISLLAEVSNFLQACATPEEAYRVVSRAGQELFPGTTGALFVYSASRNDLEVQASWGEFVPEQKERVFVPDDCWALRRGREYRIEDSRTGLPCAHVPSAQSARYLCVPMIAQGEVLGVLHLRQGQPEAGPAGSAPPLQERLLTTLAEHVALALMNLKLRETLRDQSIRDPLTGLFNRRYMEESLALEVLRAGRRHGALGVVMLDLDHFKRFNDAYGHDSGDQVLREVGALLIQRTRGGDIACRYGGEEFTLILPEMPLDLVCKRVEEIRLALKQLNMRHHGQSLGSVTISAGVAMFPEQGTTSETLLRTADQALYRAKTEGRDRVVAADAPAASA